MAGRAVFCPGQLEHVHNGDRRTPRPTVRYRTTEPGTVREPRSPVPGVLSRPSRRRCDRSRTACRQGTSTRSPSCLMRWSVAASWTSGTLPRWIGSDFAILGMTFWPDVTSAYQTRGPAWNQTLGDLNEVRNVVAHSDRAKLAAVRNRNPLTLATFRKWRRSLTVQPLDSIVWWAHTCK